MVLELPYGIGVTLRGIELWASDGTLYTSALTAGDVKIYKDGAAGANLGTLPSISVGSTYDVALTASELSAAQCVIEFVDQDGPAYVKRTITVRTVLHPSAFDPQGVILMGTAQTTGTDDTKVRLANGDQPEAGWDIELFAGPVIDRRVIASVNTIGGGDFEAVFDRALAASADNTTQYRIYGGSLATTVAEYQNGLALEATLGTPTDTDLATDLVNVQSVVDALAASDVLYKKATAVTAFVFYMELTAGGAATGITVTAQVSKDGAAFATTSASVVEISDGWYKVDLSGTEMNADEIAFKATGTGCVQRNIKIRTQS